MAVIGSDKIMKRGPFLLSPGKVSVLFSPAISLKMQSKNLQINAPARIEAMILRMNRAVIPFPHIYLSGIPSPIPLYGHQKVPHGAKR